MRDGVFIAHNSRTRERGCPRSIHECGYEVQFRVNVWASMFEDIVVNPCLLRDSLIAQKYRNSLQTVLTGLLESRGRVGGCSVTELQHNSEDSGNG